MVWFTFVHLNIPIEQICDFHHLIKESWVKEQQMIDDLMRFADCSMLFVIVDNRT